MTAIGAIYVQVKGDTTQFENDMTQLKSWATKSGKEVSNALNNAITPKTASKGIKDLSVSLSQLSQSAKSSGEGFTQSSKQIASGLSGVAKQAGITEAQYASMVEKMLRNRALTTATTQLKTLSNAMGLSARESKALAKQMGYTDTQADKMTGSLKNMRGGMGRVNTTAASFTRNVGMMTAELIGFGSAIAAAYTVKELGIAIFKTGQETLVADNAYKAITGSVMAANVEMAFLRDTSAALGMNFYTMREGYKGFLAAAQSSKIPMTEVRNIFRSISNASAVMGLSAEKTSLVFLALEQMMSKGKVSMEEIRRQMGDSLPGAFQIGAKAMGMTVEAFDKAVSAGEVYSDVFLPKFRVAMEDAFQGTIADSVKAINKLSEAWEDAKNQMAEGDFMGSIVDGMREITAMLKDPELLRGLADFTSMMGKLVAISGKYAAFQGKSFGTAMLQNEAGRLEGIGLADSSIWSLSEEQMRSMVAYYQEVEKLSESAAEKMTANAENTKDQIVITTQEARAAVKLAETELNVLIEDRPTWSIPGPEYYTALEAAKTKVSEIKDKLSEQLNKDSWLIRAEEEMKALLAAANAMPLDPIIQKLEAERAARSTAADKIEADVMKRIAKTDAAKLASYKADLAAYQASGRDKKEIEVQLNADIQKIYNKRTAAALAADKKALKELQDANEIKYAADIAAGEKLEEDMWLIKEQGFKDAAERAEEYREKQTQADFDAEEERIKDTEKAQEKADKDALKAAKVSLKRQQDAYEAFYNNIHDINVDLWRDFMDGGENALDIILDKAKDVFAQILATFSTRITMNIVESVVGSIGGTVGNTISSALGFGSGSSGGVLSGLSSANTLWGSFSGNTEALASSFLTSDTMSSLGTGVFGSSYLGLGATYSGSSLAGLGIPAADAAALGSMTGTTAASGAGSIASGISAAVPWLAVGALAIPLIMNLLEDDPDPRIGFAIGKDGNVGSDNYNYRAWLQDVDGVSSITTAVETYFDTVFGSIEDQLDVSNHDLQYALHMAGAADFETWIYRVNPEDYADFEGALTALSDKVFKGVREQFVGVLGLDAAAFDNDFFKELAGEDGLLFDAFLHLGVVAGETADFMERFTAQTEEYGESAIDAFYNLETISGVMTTIEEGMESLAATTVTSNVDALTDSWTSLIDTLIDAHAITSELAVAEQARNTVIGAKLTGLTASNIQSTLFSGGDISDVVNDSLAGMLSGSVASEIYSGIVQDFNEQIGVAFADGGLDSVIEIAPTLLDSWDLSAWDDAISTINTLTGTVTNLGDSTETVVETITAVLDSLDSFRTTQQTIASSLYGDEADDYTFTQTKEKYSGYELTPAQVDKSLENLLSLGFDDESFQNTLDMLSTKYGELITKENYIDDMIFMNDYYKTGIEELADAEEELADARASALESVQSLIDNIMSDTTGPVSKDYMQDNYSDLYGAAIADPNQVSDFTSFASDYLDFMSDYGSPAVTESVLADLSFLKNQYGSEASFADGGIISGPTSGYTVPTTFHGVEHITTDSEMKDVKSLLKQLISQNGGGDTQVRVFIGNKELKSVTAETIRTDPETQTQIRRVARV